MTEWRKIPGYERYEVSDDGRVRNGSGREMKASLSWRGYLRVRLVESKGRGREMKVHRLVALAFIPNPEDKPFINHKNCVQTDNRVANLEWSTPVENQAHAIEMGRYHAASNPRRVRKIQPEIIDACRLRYQAGERPSVMAKELGIDQGSLKRAIDGGRSQRGITAGMSRTKMTPEVAGRLKGLFAAGVHKSECARRVGVNPAVAGRILNGKRWKDAPLIPTPADWRLPEADEAS